MTLIFFQLLVFLLGGALGAALAYFWQRSLRAQERAAMAAARAQLETHFKQLSQDVLEDKSKRFTEQNQQNIEAILKPLRERIGGFEELVKDSYNRETRDRVALKEQITQLQVLNRQVSSEANQLATALRGQSKTQGNWGELVLERVLELAGLEKGREYSLQVPAKSTEGKAYFLDALVQLPDGRQIIIDSKVSLTAYLGSTSATDDDARKLALDEHVASLRKHVKELSGKEYQRLEGITSLNFVLMFVPNEAGFVEALRHDAALFTDAYEKSVVLVSPTTLLPTLRAVESSWRLERQTQNAQEIATQAGALYDKFVGFAESLLDVGAAIGKAQEHYDKARNQLTDGKGNVVRRIEQLKKMGAAAEKSLPSALARDAED
ncbi:MAG: DNA recombination protein RmuC [Pseudomonadota bacterium]